MNQLTWKVWNSADTSEPLTEGTEETCRTALVTLSLTHPSLILEDPDGREWFLRPTPQRAQDDPRIA